VKQVIPGRFRDGDDGRVPQLAIDGDGIKPFLHIVESTNHLHLQLAADFPLENG
jgi:hypothetical protein